MSATPDFDTAVAVLRRVHVDGEDLVDIAQDAGRPKAILAADLLAFLREAERRVLAAARAQGTVYRIGARGTLDEYSDLPPGCRLVPRGEP